MARKHAGLTQHQLSKKTGKPQSTISTAERSGNGSADTSIYAKACGVDVHWLATGEGQMLKGNDHHVSEPEAAYSFITTSQAIQVLRQALLVMDAATKEEVATLLSNLAKNPEGRWWLYLTDLMEKEALPNSSKSAKTDRQGIHPSNSSIDRATITKKHGAKPGVALSDALKGGDDFSQPDAIPESRAGKNH